jgi:hypothetical protein
LLVFGLLHILLRRQKLLSPGGQRVYAGLSFILLVIVKVLSILWDQQLHRHPANFDEAYNYVQIFNLLTNLFPFAIAIFILQQLIFWINATLLYFIKRRRLSTAE